MPAKNLNLNKILDDVFSVAPPQNALEQRLEGWLQDQGVFFNPFDAKYFDASADPHLFNYLVGHGDFVRINQKKAHLIYAPVGGGKTAFRVRLTRECRVNQDGTCIFPIVYRLPSPSQLGTTQPTLAQHAPFIGRQIAAELLLTMAFQPRRYVNLDLNDQKFLAAALQAYLPLTYYLNQIEQENSLAPLVQAVDHTASKLWPEPDSDRLGQFIQVMRQHIPSRPSMPPLESMLHFVKDILAYEAAFLMVDGVDAHPETAQKPTVSHDLIAALLNYTPAWSADHVYPKFFLPDQMESILPTHIEPINIRWTTKKLVNVLQERMAVASNGFFQSMAALGSPGLRGLEIETQLVSVARPLPREVIFLAGRLLLEHISYGVSDRLEPAEVQRVCAAYVEEQKWLGM